MSLEDQLRRNIATLRIELTKLKKENMALKKENEHLRKNQKKPSTKASMIEFRKEFVRKYKKGRK